MTERGNDDDVTDTASQVLAQANAARDQPVDALGWFDRDGSAVFASLCRVTAGDRVFAADVLRQTFVELDRADRATDPEPIDRRQLLLTAHRVYLADRRADDYYDDDNLVRGLVGDESEWALDRWGQALTALRGLTSRERTALNLHLSDGIALADVAALLQQPEAEVTALIDSGQRALLVTGTHEPVLDVMRHAEVWLGDDERDDVRVALGAATQRAAPKTDSRTDEASRRRWRPTKGAALSAVVVGVLAAVGVRWVQTLPDVKSPPPIAIDGLAEPETPSGQFIVRSSSDDQIVVEVTRVPDALAGAEVIFMASGLTDPLVVVPDAIIKYSDGKVGLSWHSPCNRPAIAVAITNTVVGAVIELTTGEFAVVSCIGMPSRWSAVVEAALPLAEGSIRPVGEDKNLNTTFDGYVEASAPGGTAKPISEDAGYSSALVDDANQPWVYGIGCSSRFARYQSPIGAIFEIRTETVDPDSFSSSDAIVCNNLASRPVLAGPGQATFPQSNAFASGEPVDCRGPFGSQTEVPTLPPYNSRFYDGDWSTWDGCLVRSDVIFSQSTFEACVGADVRTVTFAATIGERITSASETVTFVRDPGQVISGTRAPLLTYVIAPNDLYDTGLRYQNQQLWFSPGSMNAVYVRVGETAERWPLLTDAVACG